jgi:hypothetical protein
MMKLKLALTGLPLLAAFSYAATPTAGAAETILFEDAHIRFVQVIDEPGVNHHPAIPFPSVVFADAPSPALHEAPVDAQKSKSETRSITSRPGNKNPAPVCHVQSAVGARTVTVDGALPLRHYRIDYKRVDGTGYPAHWKTWYKDVFGPPAKTRADLGTSLLGGKPYSQEWPYDIRYNAADAAPEVHNIRYQDARLELIEVAIRVGEVEHMHGHPYYSIFADDGGFWPAGADYANEDLSKSSFAAFGDFTSPRDEPTFPKCWAATPQAPHKVTIKGGPPQHFYRVHFKQIVGEAYRSRAAVAK